QEDLWIAFEGKIYCCTQYAAYHPGGVSQLMRGAGKDATELFMKVHPWVNLDYILSDKCLVGYLIHEPA
ncbi:cytochrome b5-like heme/steroid binding domain-containing protein, partial [Chytriomyces sp. MP71]